MSKKYIVVLMLLCASFVSYATLKPASVFGDHAVLQREMPVPVWGTAEPGESVTISFDGQSVIAVAGKDGKWMAKLAPMKANATPQTLTIQGKTETITFEDILIGEVWLCGGQSNMEMPLWGSNPKWRNYDGDKHAEAGANPMIRVTRMTPYGWSQLPKPDFKMSWHGLTTEKALTMSATAFFFGQVVQAKLNVPLGLVTAFWGGTRIEPWTPPCGFDSVPALASTAKAVNAKIPGTAEYTKGVAAVKEAYTAWLADVDKAVAEGKTIPQAPEFPEYLKPWPKFQSPTVLYNHMIYPFVPYAFRGAIWYQGCNNLADGALYADKMQALFNGWKEVFQNDKFGFFFVQLAPYGGYGTNGKLATLWEAQERFAMANEPQAGMVVINDVGDFHDIHPHNKKPVGERLANMALSRMYGIKDLKPEFPRMVSCEEKDGGMLIRFTNVTKWNVPKGKVTRMEVAGLDGRYVPAQVRMDGASLFVSAAEVPSPRSVRYLWIQPFAGELFNEEGLPLGAFRKEWKPTEQGFEAACKANAKLVYLFEPLKRTKKGPVEYTIDHADEITGKVKSVLYFIQSTDKQGNHQWMGVGMDAFTDKAGNCGVPTADKKVYFQQKLTNVTVYTNVPGIANGYYGEGNIEFWPGNYTQGNMAKVPGASDTIYDWGDAFRDGEGYGSMQIHIPSAKTTLFAYNNFSAGIKADFGLGNNTTKSGHLDWTFSSHLTAYRDVKIYVYVVTE